MVGDPMLYRDCYAPYSIVTETHYVLIKIFQFLLFYI